MGLQRLQAALGAAVGAPSALRHFNIGKVAAAASQVPVSTIYF